ncbi:MAG TPA: signal peptidase I [Thermoanaerobaculia bacterium]|nr:signal peptidase I [Thermoanaerobaculia bacterium]
MKKEIGQPSAASETTEPSRHSSTREWYESLLVAAVFVLFVRTFVVQTYQVPTGSMETTILVGDHLLVNKFAYAPHLSGWEKMMPYRAVHRGDIIVFKKPGDDMNDGNVLVKRAVGTPGDVILVHAKKVTVNSETADGPHVQHIDPEVYAPGDPRGPRDYFGPFTVPSGDYFGMGDNRDNSLDSRFWGPVPRPNIFGRPFLIYWSYEAEPNSHVWRGPVAKIQQLLSVALHFFSRTRWDRMFHLVR